MHLKECTGYALLFLLSNAGSTVAQLEARATVQAYDPATDVVANARKANNDPNRKWCTMYRESVMVGNTAQWNYHVKSDITMASCQKSCSPDGKIQPGKAVTCGWWGGVNYQWSSYNVTSNAKLPGALQNAIAPCQCDDKVMEAIGKGLVEIVLPAIGQVACLVWVGAFTGFIDYFGNMAINGIEDVIKLTKKLGPPTDGHRAIVQAALQSKATFDQLEQGRDFFGKAIAKKACQGPLTDKQVNEIFDGINKAAAITIEAASLASGLGEWAGVLRMGTAAAGKIYNVGSDAYGLQQALNGGTTSKAHKREIEAGQLEELVDEDGEGENSPVLEARKATNNNKDKPKTTKNDGVKPTTTTSKKTEAAPTTKPTSTSKLTTSSTSSTSKLTTSSSTSSTLKLTTSSTTSSTSKLTTSSSTSSTLKPTSSSSTSSSSKLTSSSSTSSTAKPATQPTTKPTVPVQSPVASVPTPPATTPEVTKPVESPAEVAVSSSTSWDINGSPVVQVFTFLGAEALSYYMAAQATSTDALIEAPTDPAAVFPADEAAVIQTDANGVPITPAAISLALPTTMTTSYIPPSGAMV